MMPCKICYKKKHWFAFYDERLAIFVIKKILVCILLMPCEFEVTTRLSV
jgi:hypothetical protein